MSNFSNRQRQLLISGGLSSWLIRIMWAIVLLSLFGMPNLFVFGQAETPIQVLAPETENFPEVLLQFKINSMALPLDTDIQTDQITVVENEKAFQALSLTKDYAGVYFTLAINGARDLDLRDDSGQSIYDKLSDALVDWVSARSYYYTDQWSLVNNEGTGSLNLGNPDAWIKALEEYQPNFRNLEQGLSSLETSIQLASERVVPFGVDKILLYITPPPSGDEINQVNDLAEQALSAGIQVNVWMVGDALFLDNDQGTALMNLATSTGGQFYHFKGVETLPYPAVNLDQKGFIHTITYESGIRETGSFPITIEVSLRDQVFSGESVPFYIEISPPNPMLTNPPTVITRQIVNDEEGQETWTPETYNIEILIDFPDDHLREIAESRLYVDGDLVEKRTTPPFESLSWNIVGYLETGEHAIQVEVEDVWGLSRRSIVTPIQIEVELPEPDPPIPIQKIVLVAVILILVTAAVILIIWFARRGWKLPKFLRSRKTLSSSPGSTKGISSIRTLPDGKVYASLIPLNCSFEEYEQSKLPIINTRVAIGSDPSQASMILNQPDIAGLQADLYIRDQVFWLRDLGSSAGTWVNYTRMGTDPVQIQAGDIIHFGKSGFRFTMVGTDALSNIVVTRYEPIL